MMLVKKDGLGLQNPVTSVDEKRLSPRHARTDLTRSVTGDGDFPPLITFWNSGKKGVTEKYGMMPTTPNSRD